MLKLIFRQSCCLNHYQTFRTLVKPIRFFKSLDFEVNESPPLLLSSGKSGIEKKTPNAANKHNPPMISNGKTKPPISYKKDPTAGPIKLRLFFIMSKL